MPDPYVPDPLFKNSARLIQNGRHTYIHFKSSIINKYKDLYVLMFTHMHIYAFMFLQVFGESGKRDPYGCLASHTILLTIFDEYRPFL